MGLYPKAKERLDEIKAKYPDKFISEQRVFGNIHPGDHIFIGTACAEPQYLVLAMIAYVQANPKAFFDAELLQVWNLGLAPYSDEKFKSNFRQNSFFISSNIRDAVNLGLADYTPISLSRLPELFESGMVPVDVALVQLSPPDAHGYFSLGVSVDIVKAATEKAKLIIAQVNNNMPRTHGDGFLHIDELDFIIPHDEPLLEFNPPAETEVVQRIGKYVSTLVQDGDTIQVGYGSTPNAILAALGEKKHLGLHTELISDGVVDLIRRGVIDNSRKSINRGKSVATFCMGVQDTYRFLHDNPALEFRTIDYTNSPLIIAQHRNMTAINSALEIDLTGQASAESLGKVFFSGIGGQADFMRGAVLAPGGKTILTLASTAQNGELSRIVPFLQEGAGVTLGRSDIHYVVTEYGIAYLHGKNIRARAMELIGIAHPKFRPMLIQEAKKLNLIYRDQAFIPGKKGEYPEELETRRTTRTGLEILIRPSKISDEPLLKDFFYSLSSNSMYRRFISVRRDMPHERLQDFTAVDYTREMVLVATVKESQKEKVVGLAQYGIDENTRTAEAGIVIRDEYHKKGVGTELMSYLILQANKRGLLGLTAEVLVENTPMLHVLQKLGFEIEKAQAEGMYRLKLMFGAR